MAEESGMTEDLGTTEDLDLDLGRNWAREMFDRTRGAGEPGFTVDPAVLARAGDRRRRLRTAGAGSGLAGVVAASVALALGLGAGSTDAGSQPGPGGAWGNRPLADVFRHAAVMEQPGETYVAAPAASDLASVVSRLDPSLSHVVAVPAQSRPHIVAAGDPRAKKITGMAVSSLWVDGAASRRFGELDFGFASAGGQALISAVDAFGTGELGAPCDLPLGGAARGVKFTGPSVPKTSVPWSACTVTHQPDGSTIGSAAGRIGAGTVIVAVREFADGESFSVVARDFASPTYFQGAVPDAATVLQPAPWSQSSLAAALADPGVRSGWNPLPPRNADGTLLAPSDLGKGWSYDTSQVDQGTTGEFVTVNGCAEDQMVPLTGPGSDAHYQGPLPNGVAGTAHEAEFRLPSGSGAQTMARARSAAQGGCAVGSVDFSKDTVMALPAGIGDDAFVADVPDLEMLSVEVRVGDTILKTDLTDTDSVHDQSWTGHPVLDLSSPSDQRWLAGIARSMVARHAGAR